MIGQTEFIMLFVFAICVTIVIFVKPVFNVFYKLFIGWWLEPIKNHKKRKIEKMQEEITKAEYQKLQEQKQEENKKSAE